METKIQEPWILSSNAWYLSPDKSATGRRRNERKRKEEVSSFLTSIGFTVNVVGDFVNGLLIHEKLGKIEVTFRYLESVNRVYKGLTIIHNGRSSDITVLRKLYN